MKGKGAELARSDGSLRGRTLLFCAWAGALLVLGGCDELVEPAANKMFEHVQVHAAGEVADWGGVKAGIDRMAPMLASDLRSGTPAPPSQGEMEDLQDEYIAGQSEWAFPDGDSPMLVNPDPSEVPPDAPPAPGR